MNPRPCGYAADGTRRCRCTPLAIAGHRARLSGPLLDRLDLHVRVKPTEVTALFDSRHVTDSSALVRLRVARARTLQLERQGVLNSALAPGDLERYALPDRETCDVLQFTARRFNTSARAYGRILRSALQPRARRAPGHPLIQGSMLLDSQIALRHLRVCLSHEICPRLATWCG
jgi:magnesium chelatase family protein